MCSQLSFQIDIRLITDTKLPPKPYSFSYGVSDQYEGTDFERKEESDGNVVLGSYSVQLPDGRKQTVTYEADHHNGFKADVSYHGEAHYPPPSKEPPFVVRASPYSPQQEHHNLHEIQPINEYDQHFSRSSPDANEEVQSEILPHIQTHFQHQEQPEIQHIHQQKITKPKIVIHESDEYERTHEPDVHLHHEPGHKYSGTGSEEFTHSFSDVPDPVLPEVSYDQPSLKPEYISEHVTAIHESNQPLDHSYQSIPHQDSNTLDKGIQNNYNEGKDSEVHVFVSENKIPTGYSPCSELEDDIHHNDIKVHIPSSGTHNIAPSNEDLFIPQFINPSIPKLDQSFYQLLACRTIRFRHSMHQNSLNQTSMKSQLTN
ncbi:UNVERIFIED_CONTAM: hypothetical protein GTU68_042541 [Idotea baltica]|nr:hypothetical protein [Idotea baltica]